MVAVQWILTAAALVGGSYAAAIPGAPLTSSLESRAANLVTCRNAGGNFQIDLNKAEGNVHEAPATEDRKRSKYPHQFHNNGGFKFTNKACNAKDVVLLEFPVFPDGQLFDYTSKAKPGPDNGLARAIYTSVHKDFCGVISHTDKPNPDGSNKGPLAQCT